MVAKEEYKKLALLEEMSWRQKSREIWLKEGDRNTRFFHKMVDAHRRKNSILIIKIAGNWIFEESALKDGIVGAFKYLLFENGDWRPNCDGLTPKDLEAFEASLLEPVFSQEEVLKALTDLNEDKALGPDGFTMVFWQDN